MRRKLKGLILAGGRSSRMGSDKASLVHGDGRTQARRCHDLLREAGCMEVTLSLRMEQEIPAGLDGLADLEMVRDPAGASEGPMTGLLVGMRSDPSADWLVVACDLPLLEVGALTRLRNEVRDGEPFLAYCSDFDGLPDPLCAYYATVSLPLLEAAYAANERSLRRVLQDCSCRMLDGGKNRALENTNTPQEWASAMESGLQQEWQAELLHIYLSMGNDFKGRHGLGRLDHGITEVSQVTCVARMGLVGDRYFGYKPDFKGQVTFFDAATIQEVRKFFELPDLSASAFRRNLIVTGVDLGQWVGRRFRFQGITFEGSEECKPCYWMDETIAPGVEEFLKKNSRGGLRARIVTDGELHL